MYFILSWTTVEKWSGIAPCVPMYLQSKARVPKGKSGLWEYTNHDPYLVLKLTSGDTHEDRLHELWYIRRPRKYVKLVSTWKDSVVGISVYCQGMKKIRVWPGDLLRWSWQICRALLILSSSQWKSCSGYEWSVESRAKTKTFQNIVGESSSGVRLTKAVPGSPAIGNPWIPSGQSYLGEAGNL